jgi:site-specific recombinase XerC
MTVERGEHEAVTLDEVLAISKAKAVTVSERRIRASCCFWFLSGIRIGAFVTLPLEAVDLDKLTVKQWPKLGVKTKFQKHATTFLLPIPELLKVVRGWDDELRPVCGSKGLWFAQVSPETGEIVAKAHEPGEHRSSIACRDLRKWLRRSGLPYHSPHKFRHGHAVYAISMAKDVAALKAVSQNLMHENLSVTDGVYGVLSEVDVGRQIAQLVDLARTRAIGDLEGRLLRLERMIIGGS